MNETTRQIKAMALELGFSACGIAPAHPLEEDRAFLESWLHKGFQGQMHYLERNLHKRCDPAEMLEGAKSVISVLHPYTISSSDEQEKFRIARYAQHPDYHKVISEKLHLLIKRISELDKTAISFACVDSAPALDKRWAQQAGLGWIGKNTLLIHSGLGSFFNIGEIITTLALDYDPPATDHCGTCTKCLEACPTQALTEAATLNATRCIAYWTIEHKGDFDPTTPGDFRHFIYGCDLCQEACPYNQPLLATAPVSAFPDKMDRADWDAITEDDFNRIVSGTPLQRSGYARILRNIRHVENK